MMLFSAISFAGCQQDETALLRAQVDGLQAKLDEKIETIEELKTLIEKQTERIEELEEINQEILDDIYEMEPSNDEEHCRLLEKLKKYMVSMSEATDEVKELFQIVINETVV